MFAYQLQTRLAAAGHGTASIAAHPGITATELMRNLPSPIETVAKLFGPLIAQPPAQGALPTLRAATDPTAVGGQYYGPGGFRELRGYPVVVRSSRQSHDEDQQRRLWTESERLTGVTVAV
ncbi:hypothetical protein JOF53_007961 [Crossiella equi]|uniref:Short chain dehydrogenase n=1 Tax=Crossiella equi TaxID=130796 RepID=A0ABS5AR97_9PSEU|nr:hypothetical protein [Crossiella equi]MBP2479089.1 hypothetical protein [Crossiella equi]